MQLQPGTQFGAYEIVGLIGRGGMGEVYRARDSRLKRTVALKILPASFAGDPSRVARFQREAEVLASLNHPNIAGIYDLVDGAGANALALEFVDGESLADRLAFGPLPTAAAIGIARQIAAALTAAHSRGIIHRDLKPANVVVRTDGTAKVLDFGLAKTTDPSIASGSAETVTLAGAALNTGAGVAIGTPAYMSPEQATGGAVDARADIWAFGCVLFEMLSGRRAFEGATASDTLKAVLTQTPDWARLPQATSPALRLLLRRCLATDLRLRPATIDVITFILEEDQALSSGAVPAAPQSRSRRQWMPVAATVVVAGLALAAGAAWSRPAETAVPTVRTTIPAAALNTSIDRSFSFVGDSRFVYVSQNGGQLLSRSLDALETTPILTSQSLLRGVYPSPDGRWIAYVDNSLTIKKVAASGGTPVSVLLTDGAMRGAVWQPDDTIVFATAQPETGLQQVSAAGGAPAVLTKPDRAAGELDHLDPERLPGGRSVLFTITPLAGTTGKVAVLDLATRKWRVIVEGGSRARYVDGYLVYVAEGSLLAVRFDLSRMETVGSAAEVLPSAVLGKPPIFDISPNGTLIYGDGLRADGIDFLAPTWVARDGRETPMPVPPHLYRHMRISPNGHWLATARNDGDIYLLDLTKPGAQFERFTFANSEEWFPVWSPDSRRLLYGIRVGGGSSNVYIQDLDKSVVERLTTTTDMQIPTAMTRDGTTALLHSFPKDIQSLSLTGAHNVVTLVDSPVEERNVALSSDEHWIAYEGESPNRPGELNVYVRPYPDVGRRVFQITTNGGTFPVWSRTGNEIYFVKPDGTMAAAALTIAGGAVTVAGTSDLFRGQYLLRDGTHGRNFDVASDGRFMVLKYVRSTELGHFVIVQGWTTELKQLVK